MLSQHRTLSSYRAWAWHGSADPGLLQLTHAATPALKDGQVLVRNEVIGLNPVDWKVLAGDLVDWSEGHVPGVDGAGTVVEIGRGVGDEWLGERVAYHTSLHTHGSFAEFTPGAARALLRVPDSLPLEVAASFPCLR